MGRGKYEAKKKHGSIGVIVMIAITALAVFAVLFAAIHFFADKNNTAMKQSAEKPPKQTADSQRWEKEASEITTATNQMEHPPKYEDILIAESWKQSTDGHIVTVDFYKNGTGVLNGGVLYYFSWVVSENEVRLDYSTTDVQARYLIGQKDNTYTLTNQANENDVYVQASNFAMPTVFFEECTLLPTADSCVNVYQSGRRSSSVNGQTTNISYTYTANSNEDIQSLFEKYLEKIRECNLTCEKIADLEYAITDNKMVLANVRVNSDQTIAVNIVPGNNRVVSTKSATPIAIGETVRTENCEFTLNDVEFTYDLKPVNTSGYYRSYKAENGKVYIHIDGTYSNISKRDVCIRDLFTPKADYKDGYHYDGFVVIDDGDNGFDYVGSYIACAPLSSCHYHGLIECPDMVEWSDDPLFIYFSLDDGMTYRYDIR